MHGAAVLAGEGLLQLVPPVVLPVQRARVEVHLRTLRVQTDLDSFIHPSLSPPSPRTFSKPSVNSFLLPAAHLLVPRPVSSVDQVAYSRSP